jgi:hypothetical protein
MLCHLIYTSSSHPQTTTWHMAALSATLTGLAQPLVDVLVRAVALPLPYSPHGDVVLAGRLYQIDY